MPAYRDDSDGVIKFTSETLPNTSRNSSGELVTGSLGDVPISTRREDVNGTLESYSGYSTSSRNAAGELVSEFFSGSNLWTPANLATAPILWYDLTDKSTITLNGATISQVSDKGSASNNLVQPTASSQPTDTVEGSYHNNTTFLVSASTLTVANGDIEVLAGKFDPADSGVAVTTYSSNIISWIMTQAASSLASQARVNSRQLNGSSYPLNTRSAAFADVVTNETHVLESNLAGWSGVTLNLSGNSIGSTWNVIGTYHEYLLLAAGTSRADLDKVTGYLAWRHGSQSRLPSGHPYKNGAPTV